MKIAIIGSGNVGSALAASCLRAGHEVCFGVRDPNSAKSEKAAEQVSGAKVLSVREASSSAEVIILTTPPEAAPGLVPLLGDVTAKIIIDATNAVRTRPDPYPTAFHAIKGLTKSEKVVKCFNTTGFENMINPVYPDGAIDMFCAGNDQASKATAQKLAIDIGFATCWDFGGDDKVELLEKFALSWINLAIMQGHGRTIGFKVHRKV